jgi:hypothetical protein
MFKKMLMMLLLFLLAGSVWGGSEIWLTPDVKAPIMGKVKWEFIPEMRIKGNELYYLQNYLGINWPLGNCWETNLYYAFKLNKNGGNWQTSNLGYYDLIFKNAYLKNRVRLEQDFTKDLLKCRESLQLKWANWFVGEELFYNIKYQYLDEGRSAVGYSLKLSKQAEGTLGYLLRRQKSTISSDWVWTGVLNLGFKIDI